MHNIKIHQNNLQEHVGAMWWKLYDKEKCTPMGGQI